MWFSPELGWATNWHCDTSAWFEGHTQPQLWPVIGAYVIGINGFSIIYLVLVTGFQLGILVYYCLCFNQSGPMRKFMLVLADLFFGGHCICIQIFDFLKKFVLSSFVPLFVLDGRNIVILSTWLRFSLRSGDQITLFEQTSWPRCSSLT